ncbi:efflux RND transporter periplasmic adaptor subunit [Clostridium sp. MCC353]|uniref:efflux RND transporter periplasmic adaptor subunit n=1 Tax=Clostridium sp. MCC353 TaxID=2592646 RepID=UPI001C032AE0|nr:efflux RND transporter periplasmic adaptor subunit [Clostridium sp. MCC353]MBT9778343.1 efflux RND transporter periplasmic adaptor subunit [Clostridium sp. MCC353]
MKKKVKYLVLLLVICLAAFIAYSLLGKKEEVVIEEVRPLVMATEPTVSDITLYTDLIGTIEPAEVVTVYPKMSGDVLEVMFNVGDTVTAGQELIRINSDALDSLKIQVDGAAISKHDAELALQRTQALFATGAVSQQALEQAQSGATGAALQYEAAKNSYDLQLKYTTVTSPINGVIESKNVEVHDMASPGASICVISGQGQTTISFGVSEKVMKNLTQGMAVVVDKADTKYEGVITEVASMVDQMSGLYKVKATINDGAGLTTGSKAKVTVTMDSVQNALTVPVDAVSYANGEPFVYCLDGTKAKKVMIEAGIYDKEKMEVKSGLSPEDQVIYTWSNELNDGAEVLVKDADASETTESTETETTSAN